MDSEQYFNHIGIKKPTIISVDSLKEIHKHHLFTIPFENLDIINGIPLSMDPSHIMKKIIDNNRGGICFETNSLLYSVLKDLQYDVNFISARFWNEDQKNWNPEFSHLALTVSINKELYLVDVGIGGGFLEPLRLKNDFEYTDANGSYRVIEINPTNFILQKQEDIWKDLLSISTDPKELNEFQDQLMYYQTSKETIFTQNKIVNLLTIDGRISLTDNQLKITKNKLVTVREFKHIDDWQKIYRDYFQPFLLSNK